MPLRVFALCLSAFAMTGCGGGEWDPHSADAAKFVLSAGGSLHVVGRSVPVESPGALPEGEFGIERIELKGAKIKDEDLKKLSGLKNLKYVGLYQVRVGDKGIEHLAEIPTLTELELSGTNMTDKGLDALAKLPNLKKLFIRNTMVTEKKVEEFRAAHPEVTVYY